MIKALSLLLLLVAMNASAIDRMTVFTKYEFNDTDRISGLGVSGIIGTRNSDLKAEVITSINNISVVDTFGFEEEYLGLDLGMRFGYFGDLFMYVEGGLDVFEAVFKHDDDEPIFGQHDGYSSDTLDGYAAFGGGFQAGKLRVEGFVKARQINAEYWEADKNLFYGMQLSLAF